MVSHSLILRREGILRDKRGWLRIAEACISLLIVITMLLILTRSKSVEPQQDIIADLPPVLDEIAKTESFRERIIVDDPNIQSQLESFVKERLPHLGVEFRLLICKTTDPCNLASTPSKDVYAAERIISGSLSKPHPNPRRIRLFVWR